MTSGATSLTKFRHVGSSVASVLTLIGFGSFPAPPVAAGGTDAWSSMSGLDVARQQVGWPFLGMV